MLPFASGLSPALKDVLRRMFGNANNQIDIPGGIGFPSIIQSMIGAALLFLLLLAIRNRFKIG